MEVPPSPGILKQVFVMKASLLTPNLAFDLVFPLVTPIIHVIIHMLPIQLNQDNRRTKDEFISRKLKKKSISSLKELCHVSDWLDIQKGR